MSEENNNSPAAVYDGFFNASSGVVLHRAAGLVLSVEADGSIVVSPRDHWQESVFGGLCRKPEHNNLENLKVMTWVPPLAWSAAQIAPEPPAPGGSDA